MSFYIIFYFEINLALSAMRKQRNKTSINQHIPLHCHRKNSHVLTLFLKANKFISLCSNGLTKNIPYA